MNNHLSGNKRSWNMSRIRSVDTSPEIIVRSILHQMGYRFRLHRKDLPGKPDIVLPKYKMIIFVHGCFWHMHKKCRRGNVPKSNKEYWIPKLKRNVDRDKENRKKLKALGWKVSIIWECETNNRPKLSLKLKKILESSSA